MSVVAICADPSRVIIKAILPTFITAEAFLESVTFALEHAPDGLEGVHGGFDSQVQAQVRLAFMLELRRSNGEQSCLMKEA